MKKIVFALPASLMLFGCAAMYKPTPEQERNADYGTYPEKYQEIIKDYFSITLKDPYSAVYSDWKGPTKGWISGMDGVSFGYRACVNVNAKNSLGGYVGIRQYLFVINNDTIVKSDGGYRGEMSWNIAKICNSL